MNKKNKAAARPKRRKRSKFEERIAKLLPSGTKYEDESFMYTKLHTYIPDFTLPNGVLIETKGRFTSADRTKHRLVKSQHPSLDIRFIFMRDNKLNKTSKTTYTQWAEKNGFKYAVGTVPPEWLKEKKKT